MVLSAALPAIAPPLPAFAVARLLSVPVASFILVNAVVRNGDAEASENRILRWAALVLALAIFPLALLAVISTGTRIAEYGLSPERLWGVVAVAVAVAYGLAYFVAPIRGRHLAL